MTSGSMPPTNNPSQGFADSAQDSIRLHRIATELYRFHKRDDHADLRELTPGLQETYLSAAAACAYQTDEARLRPAVYDAADQLTPAGLNNMSRAHRAEVTKGFLRAFRVFRDHLAGKRHPDTVDLMRALSQKDMATVPLDEPVTAAGVDLAALAVTTEVM